MTQKEMIGYHIQQEAPDNDEARKAMRLIDTWITEETDPKEIALEIVNSLS